MDRAIPSHFKGTKGVPLKVPNKYKEKVYHNLVPSSLTFSMAALKPPKK